MSTIYRAEANGRGMYECEYCRSEYDSPACAATCCDTTYDEED